MDTKGLKTGHHVAFRQTFINTGEIVSFGVGYAGRTTAEIKGTNGSKGATTTLSSVVRIPGPDEAIVSKEYLDGLLADSEKLSLLEIGGVDNWEFYEEAIRGNE